MFWHCSGPSTRMQWRPTGNGDMPLAWLHVQTVILTCKQLAIKIILKIWRYWVETFSCSGVKCHAIYLHAVDMYETPLLGHTLFLYESQTLDNTGTLFPLCYPIAFGNTSFGFFPSLWEIPKELSNSGVPSQHWRTGLLQHEHPSQGTYHVDEQHCPEARKQ